MIKARIITVCLLLALLAAPMLVEASDISGALYYATILVSNNSTDPLGVATVAGDISTTVLQNGGYLNSSANNCVVRNTAGADIKFMPGYTPGGYPWCFWVPTIGNYSYLNYILYTANSTGGDIAYFPGDGGMSISDNDTIEPGSGNFTIELNDTWIDTTANGTAQYLWGHYDGKIGGIRCYVSPSVSENITVMIYGYVGSTNTITKRVAANNDDFMRNWTGSDWTFVLAAPTFDAGYYDATHLKYGSGAVFDGVAIPQGVIITSANITLTAHDDNAQNTVKSRIWGQDVDNATAFSDEADFLTRLAQSTTANVSWDAIPAFVTDTEYKSPEIKTIIQEIVDRPGWASGNSMAIMWEDFENRSTNAGDTRRRSYSHDDTPAKAPLLTVTYQIIDILATVTATGVTTGEHDVKVEQEGSIPSDWLSGWTNRIPFFVEADRVDDNLTHFPMLMYLSASSGIGSDNLTAVFDEIGANYKKLAVTKSDGLTELYVEVEEWDDTGEEAWLWVSSNTSTLSSATDTDFYLYYDNEHADNNAYVGVPNDAVVHNVWDSEYILVDHLEDDGDNASTYDSTSYNHDGAKKGANEPIETTGQVGYAQDFDGTDDRIDITDTADLSAVTPISLEAWIKHDTGLAAHEGIISKDDGTNREWLIICESTADRLYFMLLTDSLNNLIAIGTSDIADGTWHHVAGTWDGVNDAGHMKLYVDGASENLTLDEKRLAGYTPHDTGSDVEIGRYAANNDSCFEGSIDEVRISNAYRSTAWVKSAYYTAWDNFIDYDGGASENITGYFRISIDGVVEDSTTPVNVPNSTADWTVGDDDATPYIGEFIIEKNGVVSCNITWEYGDTFFDTSVNSNDATPTFRSATSNPNVTANMTAFYPMSEAEAPDYVLEDAPPFIDASALTSNITGTFGTTPGAGTGTFPLAGVITSIANATNTPAQLPLLIIACFIIIAGSMTFSALTRIHGSGSVLVKTIIICCLMGIFVALGNFAIDLWMIIVFAIIAGAMCFASRQLGWT